MSSPENTKLIGLLRRNAARPASYETTLKNVDKMRENFVFSNRTFVAPADTEIEVVDAGGVPAERITAPGSAHDRAILYLHGGGYVIGSVATHRAMIAALSAASGCSALGLDYRLAPEHPFPAAIEDATAGYRWLLNSGIDASRIIIAGDSAGGGLTIATLVALRDAGDPLPAAACCLSPWVDLEGLGESMTTRAKADPMVQRDGLLHMARMYAGEDVRNPLASPLHADLSRLPPILIQVGDAEVLLDDSTRLSERAREAGVEAELDVWPEMVHVFQMFAPMLPEGHDATLRMGNYIRKHID